DVAAFPVVMKKGRPGHVLQVLAHGGAAAAIEALLLADSPTLGVRRHSARRRILPRRSETLATSLGEVRVKVATLEDGSERFAPEFDDLARVAEANGLSLDAARRRVLDDVAKSRRKA